MREFTHVSSISTTLEHTEKVAYADASVRFGKSWRLSDTDENPSGWAYATNWGKYGLGVRAWKRNQPKITSLSTWMEVVAVIEASKGIVADEEILVYTDSRMAISIINGWKRTGKLNIPSNQRIDIRHIPYFEKYATLFGGPSGKNLKVKWIPGHKGNPMNELVDGLARLASRALIDELSMEDVDKRSASLATAFYKWMEGMNEGSS